MTRSCLTLTALALICACRDKPVPAAADAAPAGQAASGPAGWALSPPMLEGYLRYQRTLLVQAGKLQPPRWDGGLKSFEEPSVEQKASLDERARLEAGLTVEDVLKIEAMLSKVSARRMTARLMHMDEQMPAAPVLDPDDPSRGADLEKALKTQANLKKLVQDLPDEREAFGTANIDVLLRREDELLKNWGLMMQVPELAQGKR